MWKQFFDPAPPYNPVGPYLHYRECCMYNKDRGKIFSSRIKYRLFQSVLQIFVYLRIVDNLTTWYR